MKTLLTALAAATALTAVGGAAAAQPYGYDRDGRYEQRYDRGDRYDGRWERDDRRGRHENINARQAEIQRRIAWADRRGLLDRAERNKVLRGVDEIARQEAMFRRGGLDYRERAELNRRLDLLEASLDWRIRNHDYAWRR